MNWINPAKQLPQNTNRFSYQAHISDVVLVWVGENDYSHREWTTAEYDHRNTTLSILEPKLANLVVIAWTYPVPFDGFPPSAP